MQLIHSKSNNKNLVKLQRILFITYGGGHVQSVLPVIMELRKSGKYRLDVIGLTTSVKTLNNNSIKYFEISEFANEKIRNLGRPLADKYHVQDKGIAYESTAAYYGIGIKDLIDTFGKEVAYKKFSDLGRKAFLPVNHMKYILKLLNPDLVVSTSAPRFEMATLIAANKMGIKSLRIEQLYATSEIPNELKEGTFFCGMNSFVKRRLINKGVNKEVIFVTGQPAFDKVFSSISNHKESQIRNKYNIDKNKKLVLWASQKTKDQEELLEELLRIEKKNENLKLIIKLHPNEDSKLHYEKVKNAKSEAIIAREDLHDLIYLSDVVVTEYSTVGFEAIFYDKPLVTFNITGKPDIIPYAESGVAIAVGNKKNLETSINECFYNDGIKKKLGYYRKQYSNDGLATKRVCQKINEIINEVKLT